MSMLKFGDTFYQGQKKEIYLVGGRAIKDAESKEINGKAHSSVTIVGQETTPDTTIFLSLEGWNETANAISKITKGNYVLAYGQLNSREYNGKTYYSIKCDWIFPFDMPKDALNVVEKAAITSMGNATFTPLTDEKDLPF